MSLDDRDWYRDAQNERERRGYGGSYQNTTGWYYRLGGETFGPCDKDNIMRLIREGTLSGSTLVKHVGLNNWTPIRDLAYEFPIGGGIHLVVDNTSGMKGKKRRNRRQSASVYGKRRHGRIGWNLLKAVGVLLLVLLLSGRLTVQQMVNMGRSAASAVTSFVSTGDDEQRADSFDTASPRRVEELLDAGDTGDAQDSDSVAASGEDKTGNNSNIREKVRTVLAGGYANGLSVSYGDAPTGIVETGTCYFYDQMDEADQRVYELFVDLAAHRAEEGYSSEVIIPASYGTDFAQQLNRILYAVYMDHPEYYWLVSNVSKDRLSIQSVDNHSGSLHIVYTLQRPTEEESAQAEALKEATASFLSGVDLSAQPDQIALEIHDRLIDLVTYDDPVAAGTTAVMQAGLTDLGATVYGALVADSSGTAHTATCMGYALAYEYLLHQAGIYSTVVHGVAFSSNSYLPDLDGHAWNLVQLGGDWYETDSCWDDYEPSAEQLGQSFVDALLSDQQKYEACRHHFYNLTTEEIYNLPVGEDVTFQIPGYQPYSPFSATSHQRANNAKQDMSSVQLQNYLDGMLPQAEGTVYAWQATIN